MNPAKIQFSEEESALLQQADWLLTKNRIIGSIYDLMGLWSQDVLEREQELRLRLPEEVFTASPKISKGESYQGLPWVMLDQPRYFSKEQVFALRTFFWWGRHWTVTLHLKGDYTAIAGGLTQDQMDVLAREGYVISGRGDEWDHHWVEQNGRSFRDITKKELSQLVQQAPFIKIGKNISLNNWQRWYADIAAIRQCLLDLVPHQFPKR